MKKREITVLKVDPRKEPVVTTLTNDLDSLQKAVSIGADYQGLIEIIGLEENVVLLCNEEGKLIGMEGNRRIGRDIITGVFYVVGVNDEGDLDSLPEEKIQQYMARFREPEYYDQADVTHALFLRIF